MSNRNGAGRRSATRHRSKSRIGLRPPPAPQPRTRPVVWPGWLALGLWTVVLFYLAVAPSGMFPRMPGRGIPWDKGVHAVEWAAWGGLLATILARQFPRLAPARLFLTTALAAGVAGLAHELVQIPVAGRVCDPFDWLADMAGALAAAWVVARAAGFLRGTRPGCSTRCAAPPGRNQPPVRFD